MHQNVVPHESVVAVLSLGPGGGGEEADAGKEASSSPSSSGSFMCPPSGDT